MQKRVQRQEQRGELQILPIRLSKLLEVPEDEYRRWVARLEGDPLFRRLAGGEGARILRRKPWTDARWHASYAGEEPAAPASPATSAEKVPAPVLALVRRIGREPFERCFLRNDGSMPLDEAARACGLTEAEARLVADFLDGVTLEAEAGPPTPVPAPAPPWRVVAAIEREGDRLIPAFLSAHYARGRWSVDYEGLDRLRRSGSLTEEEWGRVRELVRQVELVNAKQTVLAGLLRLAAAVQRPFLLGGRRAELVPFAQKTAAGRLEASPSAVSRALQGRAVRLPWGEDAPLDLLFPSTRDAAVARVAAALERDPALTGRQLRERLKTEAGMDVTVRSANLFRALARRRHG